MNIWTIMILVMVLSFIVQQMLQSRFIGAGVEQSAVTAITYSATYEPTGNEDANWACDVDGNGDITEAVQLHGYAAFGDVLRFGVAQEVLGNELGRLADGDGVANGNELVGIVTMHQIRHHQIAGEHHPRFFAAAVRAFR